MQKITWLIMANATKALIYQLQDLNHQLLYILTHEESRLKNSDLVSDAPGHYQTSHTARGAWSSVDQHEEEHDKFAKQIALKLHQDQHKGRYESLVLCAEPHFYGLLDQHLSSHVKAMLYKVIQKDYIPLPPDELDSIITETTRETARAL